MRALWLAALALVAMLAPGVATVRAEAPAAARNVLLVTDGTDVSRWAPVIPLLVAAGLQVETAQTMATAPDAFIDAVRESLQSYGGPTVLVGEGWSGTVVSALGTESQVSALVYLAAIAPETGDDFHALAARFSVKAEVVRGMEPALPMRSEIEAPALREKPRFYAVASQDEDLPAELQRFYAARMKAKTFVLDSGALVMKAHPREVAGLILEAAGMKPPACGADGDDGIAACAAPALPRSLAEGCKCTKEPLESLTEP
jgi:pimeloyl-ACP methyl ester carboxylesterase